MTPTAGQRAASERFQSFRRGWGDAAAGWPPDERFAKHATRPDLTEAYLAGRGEYGAAKGNALGNAAARYGFDPRAAILRDLASTAVDQSEPRPKKGAGQVRTRGQTTPRAAEELRAAAAVDDGLVHLLHRRDPARTMCGKPRLRLRVASLGSGRVDCGPCGDAVGVKATGVV